MKQFKYSIGDLGNNKLRAIIIIIQILVSLIILNLFLSITGNYISFNKSIQKFEALDNSYLMFDTTDNIVASKIVGDSNNLSKIKELNDYIIENNLLIPYTIVEDSIFLGENFDRKDRLIVNFNYLNYFNLKIIDGKSLSYKEFSSINNITPTLIGSKLSKKYKVNDIIKDSYGNLFKVQGILEKNQNLFNLKSSPNPINLDNSIITPIEFDKNYMLSYYDMVLNSTFIKTNNSKNLNLIIEKSNDLNLFNYHFKSIKNQIEDTKIYHKELFSLYLYLFLIIFVFLFFSIYSTILQYINKYIFEFSVHILCGATYLDIFKRIFNQIFFLFSISIILITILGSILNGLIILLFSVLFSISISVMVCFTLKRNNLLSLMKGDLK